MKRSLKNHKIKYNKLDKSRVDEFIDCCRTGMLDDELIEKFKLNSLRHLSDLKKHYIECDDNYTYEDILVIVISKMEKKTTKDIAKLIPRKNYTRIRNKIISLKNHFWFNKNIDDLKLELERIRSNREMQQELFYASPQESNGEMQQELFYASPQESNREMPQELFYSDPHESNGENQQELFYASPQESNEEMPQDVDIVQFDEQNISYNELCKEEEEELFF